MQIDGKELNVHSIYDKNNRAEGSGSHTDRDDAAVLQVVLDHWDDRFQGDTDDCWMVPVPADGWFCPEVQMQDGDTLVGTWGKRPGMDDDTAAYHVHAAKREKSPAKTVHLVIYEVGEGYELVTALATLGDGVPPMNVATTLRNIFELPGGSAIKKLETAEQKLDYIRESFMFWDAAGLAPTASQEDLEKLWKSCSDRP